MRKSNQRKFAKGQALQELLPDRQADLKRDIAGPEQMQRRETFHDSGHPQPMFHRLPFDR